MPTPLVCWVCGKPLGSGDYKLDEFGFAIHPECYTNLIDGKLPNRKTRTEAALNYSGAGAARTGF